MKYDDTANSDFEGGDVPEALLPMLAPLIADIDHIKTEDIGVITRALKSMDATKITTLIDIAKDRKGTRHTEERIIKMAQNAWPQLETLECAKYHISRVQNELTKTVVSIYAEEFHTYKAGEATFDNDEFVRVAQKELDMREGASEAHLEAPARNCIVQ